MSSLHNRFVSVTIDNSIDEQTQEKNNEHTVKETNVCSICCENMVNSFTTTLKCCHTYHTECYTSYIAYNVINKKESINCPLCRDNILEITVTKPDVIHIVSGDHDIENQSGYDDDVNNDTQSGCISTTCCANLVAKSLMVVAVYFTIDAIWYCSNNIC